MLRPVATIGEAKDGCGFGSEGLGGEETGHLEFDDREYLLNILSKRQIELRRIEVSKQVKEALKVYKEGNVKSGKLNELWKDLND
ncbi:hypothetical protein METP1_01136 [Methanosarcinales archaeon]|nr:hypothetical protein METP1_01136 [Methanosarcinales archaeon]